MLNLENNFSLTPPLLLYCSKPHRNGHQLSRGGVDGGRAVAVVWGGRQDFFGKFDFEIAVD